MHTDETHSDVPVKAGLVLRIRHRAQLLLTRPSAREIELALVRVGFLRRVTRTAGLLSREFLFQIRNHDLNTKSAALTYSCILALGPLLASLFFFFHRFGGLDALINKTLVPLIAANFSNAAADQLKGYLTAFVSNFKPDVLGSVAIASFLVTVVGLLVGIERAFNDIFAVRFRRPLWRQVINYWTLLTITPFALVVSTGKTAQFFARYPALDKIISQLSFLGHPLSIAIQSLGFAVLILILPNKKIPLKAVLAGGLTAGIGFQLLKALNVFLTRNIFANATATALYGTAPILAIAFFFWIKLVWLVILSGACLSVSITSIDDVVTPSEESSSPSNGLVQCSRVFSLICADFKRSGEGISAAAIATALKLDPTEVTHWLTWLGARKTIFSASTSGTERFFPTHQGLRLERDPKRFLASILMTHPKMAQIEVEESARSLGGDDTFTRSILQMLQPHEANGA
jgi:membrane protein